ncbi:MAG: class I SAM-dependent methyltransferase [Gemmatimonadaceae bacterium]
MTGEPQVRRSASTGSDVAQAYDRWSRRYDDDHNATRDLDARIVRQSPLHVAGARVLELGCGTGKNSEWLAAQARTLVALDFSPGMLDVARRRVRSERTRFVEHDITRRWPVEPSSIDLVVGNLVLEHVRDLGPIYAEAARVLRPGGQLFVCELHPYRQLRGGQAHFEDAETNEVVPVTAYQHSVSEYVTGGLTAGFTLRTLGEHVEESASTDSPPRLLSVLFER